MPTLIPYFIHGEMNRSKWSKEIPEDMWNDLAPSFKEYFYNCCEVIETSTEKNK